MPGADAVLRAVGERFPGAVRTGFPAHITVLHPFLPLSDVDDEVVAELAATFARRGPLRVEFAVADEPRHFDEGFVALRLEPDGALRELTAELCARWGLRPYGGAYGEPDPHLTVALDVAPEQARLIAEQAAGALPPPADLAEAWLVVFDGAWSLRARLPLAPGGTPQ
ncbi:2'-5' RNA ligase family protein [Saccharopolyspora sp. NFXS83]|uniref:2'-5' RNA ligase family protein n=1 Tax=Saccharopolyspora sp. NFXS83 TaxID=2993560 RepID=UPI00224B9EF0|nr:2'-5' RNA ligase family protein [Saccharopolyspora sp. NFXS83]MCX2730469.1 2'-5' RNA ligase family protein [Saccharopolyspora sp. NFXS83]